MRDEIPSIPTIYQGPIQIERIIVEGQERFIARDRHGRAICDRFSETEARASGERFLSRGRF